MSKKLPLHKVMRAELHGWLLLGFGFFGFIAWAALYPIDQGIYSAGHVISGIGSIEVTSSAPGTIKKIYKANGNSVITGDLIMEIDVRPIEPQDRNALNLIKQLELSNTSLNEAFLSRMQQVRALESRYVSFEKLLHSGFTSKNYLSTIEGELSAARGDTFEIKSRIEENATKIRELKEKIGAIRASPVSGTLINMDENTPGSDVKLGQQLFSVKPDSDDLLISVQIPVDYASQIRTGLDVNVIFPTVPGGMTVQFAGTLDHISNDRQIDEKTNLNYFNGLVKITDVAKVNRLAIKTGLPVNVVIKAGRRTLLSYITRPFTERLYRGLR
jgi:multidrug efflux pump subunit AcrA (membrane-fusion protein)